MLSAWMSRALPHALTEIRTVIHITLLLNPIDDDSGVSEGFPAVAEHESLHAHVRGLDVPEERLLVVGPLLLEGGPGGVPAAAELEGDLEAVGVDVVEVLHAAGHVVPPRSVRDSAWELHQSCGYVARGRTGLLRNPEKWSVSAVVR